MDAGLAALDGGLRERFWLGSIFTSCSLDLLACFRLDDLCSSAASAARIQARASFGFGEITEGQGDQTYLMSRFAQTLTS